MTTIRLHNTRTRRKEDFAPLDPENVRMYVCGPTVYDRAHLGNARPVVVFDVLYRLLRHVYGADHVTYVRNFTDVDDKINARAKESGRAIGEITAETTQWFLDDMAALGALEPDAMPRATQYIPQMVAMIAELIARGHAYEAEGHVLFAVESYAEYGQLSGRSVDDMIAGARVEVAPYKRNPMDFVLWKPSGPDLPGWESPWGRGRPGWHIECSAMSHELLGESFDIHGGGNDLMFPHHENEIAQSCCAHPEGDFARVWMHNEMLQVEGRKMSKSLGNFFTVRDLLEGKTDVFGGPMTGDEIRLAFLLSHYRSPMDFSQDRIRDARQALASLAKMLGQCGEQARRNLAFSEPLPEVLAHLSNDLDCVSAIKSIYEAATALSRDSDPTQDRLNAIYSSQMLLGFDLKDSATAIDRANSGGPSVLEAWWWSVEGQQVASRAGREAHFVQKKEMVAKAMADQRAIKNIVYRIEKARAEKNYAESDRLRDALVAAGVEVKITADGVQTIRLPHFDASKLEALK